MVGCDPIVLRYSDGYEAHARFWLPQAPRGAVLYLHGIQSHGFWFESSAQQLADAGFAVLLPDRRGSGRNRQDRGHTPSARRLILDTAECCDRVQARTGLSRVHVLGVSWGGKQALALYGHSPERVASLTLVAPGLFPSVDVPTSQKIRIGLAAVTGGHALFDIPLQQAELFTANPERQEFIRHDELALRQVTASFMVASRRLDALARRVEGVTSGPPLCLFLAELDRIIDNARTRDFVRRLDWPGRRIIEYPSAHHTIEFEPDPQPFFGDLVNWLTSQAEAGKHQPGA